jgi:hypothetical protein
MRRRADDMILNEKILKGLERSYRKAFPGDLNKYLLVKYGEEPFPYEFTEQDLYENIRRDICNYEAGVFLASLKCSVPELNYCSTLVPVLAIDGRVF